MSDDLISAARKAVEMLRAAATWCPVCDGHAAHCDGPCGQWRPSADRLERAIAAVDCPDQQQQTLLAFDKAVEAVDTFLISIGREGAKYSMTPYGANSCMWAWWLAEGDIPSFVHPDGSIVWQGTNELPEETT